MSEFESFDGSLGSAIEEAKDNSAPSSYEVKDYDKMPAATIKPALRHGKKAHKALLKQEKRRQHKSDNSTNRTAVAPGPPKVVFDTSGRSVSPSGTGSGTNQLGFHSSDVAEGARSLRSHGTRTRGGQRRQHFGLTAELEQAASIDLSKAYQKNDSDPPTARMAQGLQFGMPQIVNQSTSSARSSSSFNSTSSSSMFVTGSSSNKFTSRTLTLPELQEASALTGNRRNNDNNGNASRGADGTKPSAMALFWGDDGNDSDEEDGVGNFGYSRRMQRKSENTLVSGARGVGRKLRNTVSENKSAIFQVCVASKLFLVLIAMVILVIVSSPAWSSPAKVKPSEEESTLRSVVARPSPSLPQGVSPTEGAGATTWTVDSMLQVLSDRVSSTKALRDKSKPEGKALNWLGDDLLGDGKKLTEHGLVQRYAMAVFYFSTQREDWTNQEGWVSAAHECTWHGVVCSNGGASGNEASVSHLKLNENNIHGELRADLSLLTDLVHLELVDNYLEGGIPDECLMSWSKMRSLFLSENFLSGNISDKIGQLTSLEHLDLSNNELKGPIPSTIEEASNLVDLRIANNRINGELPASIGKLSKLQVLFLGNNELTGSIPAAILSMSSTKALLLYENDLRNELPDVTSTSLVYIHLDENALTGRIPKISASSTLKELRLERNRFKSNIPAQLGDITSLELLWVNDNQLDGEVPGELGRLKSLKSLRIEGNQLSGSVPSAVCDLTHQNTLSFFHAVCGRSNPKLECSCCNSCKEDPFAAATSGLRRRNLMTL